VLSTTLTMNLHVTSCPVREITGLNLKLCVVNPDRAKAREMLTGDLVGLENVVGKPQRRGSHRYADRGHKEYFTTWVMISNTVKAWKVLSEVIRTMLNL
jgi:hypothetical protein